jgi:hypothetical protein
MLVPSACFETTHPSLAVLAPACLIIGRMYAIALFVIIAWSLTSIFAGFFLFRFCHAAWTRVRAGHANTHRVLSYEAYKARTLSKDAFEITAQQVKPQQRPSRKG